MIKHFGENNYELLLADLVDLSSAVKWNDEQDYVLNNLVNYEGIVYKLIVAENSTNDAPNCHTDWIIAPKFNKSCYNDLWETGKGGLRKILSWIVFAEAIPFYPNILGASGYVDSGNSKDFKSFVQYQQGTLRSNVQGQFNSLLRWNQKNNCIQILSCSEDIAIEQNKSYRTTAW